MIPVFDFHCDLLLYLQGDSARTPFDPICRCAHSQMKKGGVKWQILPISETIPDSSEDGERQIAIFSELPKKFPEQYRIMRKANDQTNDAIGILLAIENASIWCSDEDDLESRLKRLGEIDREVAKIVYISMTWNFENRFGGGALTTVGLKEDGKKLLDFLHGKKIAVDLSHTSDSLARDLLNYIDQKNLKIPVIASHSNCRSIHDVPRNLPDELIGEIFKRDGVIGLNTIRSFVCKPEEGVEKFVDHLAHCIDLGGEKKICLGLDFFFEEDVAGHLRKSTDELFFREFPNSSCYPKLLQLCQGRYPSIIEGISHQNALHFLKRFILVS